MARQEQDREDLLRDATALVERVELSVAGFDVPVFVGFRRDGCASVYIDQDPAYHFNTGCELRRAFVDGRLYKSEKRRLVSMLRNRLDGEVQLVRSDLSDGETKEFLTKLRSNLDRLSQSLAEGDFTVVGQVPDEVDVVARSVIWLEGLPYDIPIAESPRAH